MELVIGQLQNYDKCSGQLTNIDKSYFLINPKSTNNQILRVKEVTGYMHANFPITYLDVFVCGKIKDCIL